jgi:hypothetical protein
MACGADDEAAAICAANIGDYLTDASRMLLKPKVVYSCLTGTSRSLVAEAKPSLKTAVADARSVSGAVWLKLKLLQQVFVEAEDCSAGASCTSLSLEITSLV